MTRRLFIHSNNYSRHVKTTLQTLAGPSSPTNKQTNTLSRNHYSHRSLTFKIQLPLSLQSLASILPPPTSYIPITASSATTHPSIHTCIQRLRFPPVLLYPNKHRTWSRSGVVRVLVSHEESGRTGGGVDGGGGGGGGGRRGGGGKEAGGWCEEAWDG